MSGMTSRRLLAKHALMKALRLRRDWKISPDEPVCPYDLADSMGVEVRFMDLPSLEGIYSNRPEPVIIVSSLRPPGRQAYTCGHELGHHVFEHGFRIDELIDGAARARVEDEEFLADCFAGFLLMPKSAVIAGFSCRGWTPESCGPAQLYTVAGWLGVGYGTLITHLCVTLGLLSHERARSLLRSSPKDIKAQLLGSVCSEGLVVVDYAWSRRAIDLQVGDLVMAMTGVVTDKPCVVVESDKRGSLLQAKAPGLGRICHPDSGWSAFVRVSRRGYVGRGIFRHEEEVEDEHDPAVCE
jgi:hypothetical protein